MTYIRSPLSWKGSKFRFLDSLLPHLDVPSFRHIEPFLGSGTVPLNISNSKEFILSDLNPDIINFFSCVQENPEKVALYTNSLFTLSNQSKESFLGIRKDFNDAYARQNFVSLDFTRAAMFLYLDLSCFGGTVRYNHLGEINQSFSNKQKHNQPPKTKIYLASEKLRHATIRQSDWKVAVREAKEGDVLYLDPPYMNAGHNYTDSSFSLNDQLALRDEAISAWKRGSIVVVSNSSDAVHLYEGIASEIVQVHTVQTFGNFEKAKRPPREEIIAIWRH